GRPDRAFLAGKGAAQSDHELHDAAEAVGAVGEVAVISGGDEEHAHDVEGEAEPDVAPRRSRQQHAERGHVDHHEGETLGPVDGDLLRTILARGRYSDDGWRGRAAMLDGVCSPVNLE